jgi:hypothetical protein
VVIQVPHHLKVWGSSPAWDWEGRENGGNRKSFLRGFLFPFVNGKWGEMKEDERTRDKYFSSNF